jgi:serine/threonine protein kinase
VVYRGLDTWKNEGVALKKIRFEGEEDGVPATALREITTLTHLRHPNVVELKDFILEPGKLYLVFELIDMDLKKLIEMSEQPFNIALIKSYTAQLLDGLAYCHSMGVMHRDLKPHNLLVSHTGSIKLADFGLARTFTPAGRPLTVEVITRWYRAPEILMGCQNYRCCVDVWSVGCIIAEMANMVEFVKGDSEIDQLHLIFKAFGTPNDEKWPGVEQLPYWRNNFPQFVGKSWDQLVPSLGHEGWDLLEALMTYNPLARVSARDALDFPFVRADIQTPIGSASSQGISPPGGVAVLNAVHAINTSAARARMAATVPSNLASRGLLDEPMGQHSETVAVELAPVPAPVPPPGPRAGQQQQPVVRSECLAKMFEGDDRDLVSSSAMTATYERQSERRTVRGAWEKLREKRPSNSDNDSKEIEREAVADVEVEGVKRKSRRLLASNN